MAHQALETSTRIPLVNQIKQKTSLFSFRFPLNFTMPSDLVFHCEDHTASTSFSSFRQKNPDPWSFHGPASRPPRIAMKPFLLLTLALFVTSHLTAAEAK